MNINGTTRSTQCFLLGDSFITFIFILEQMLKRGFDKYVSLFNLDLPTLTFILIIEIISLRLGTVSKMIDVRICVVNPNYTLPIPCLSLWSERHSFSHGITSFSFVFFGVSYFLTYNKLSATFLLLLLLHLLTFRDERNMSMLTQNILPSSIIFIQKQKTYPIPKLYPFF